MFDHALPTGLEVHCDKCNLVVPSDAPRPAGGDCEFVATHKLAWFNPNETIAGQFCMAAAAWSLIYHEPLSKSVHPESSEYLRQFKLERSSHYAQSTARQAMTSEQVAAERGHKRDGHLYPLEGSECH
jgi:hypothetical protein